MTERANLLPEPRFTELRVALLNRLEQVGAKVNAENFQSFFDPLMREVLLRGFAEAQAHEGTVWLLDEAGEHLVPAYNSGPHADKLVGRFKQPLNAGLICMVFASEQPFVENEVYKNSQQSKLLDKTLGVQTYALIAVPFNFLDGCRGVVSCVQLRESSNPEMVPPGFTPAGLRSVQRAALTLSRLIELRLIRLTVGLSSE